MHVVKVQYTVFCLRLGLPLEATQDLSDFIGAAFYELCFWIL